MNLDLDIVAHYTHEFVVFFAALIFCTWICNVLAVLIDLWTGIEKAKAKGEKIRSGGLRRTITKIGDYWKVQAFGLMIDVFGSLFYSCPFASMAIGLGIIAIEGRSVIENLREKRASAADLPQILSQIISANNQKDAMKILQAINQTLSKKEE